MGVGLLLGFRALVVGGSTWLVPEVVRRLARDWTRRELNLELGLGEVRFDSLRLGLTLTDVALPQGPAPIVSVRRVDVDLGWPDLVAREWRVERLELAGPRVDARIDAQGRLNLRRLVPPPSDEPTPSVRLRAVHLHGGWLSFHDARRGPNAQLELAPLTLKVMDLHSRKPEPAAFHLVGRSAELGRLEVRGTVTLATLAAQGRLGAQGLSLAHLARLAPLPATVRSGTADLDATFAHLPGPREAVLDLRLAALPVRGLNLGLGPALLHADVRAGGLGAGPGRLRLSLPRAAPPAWSGLLDELVVRDLVVDGTGPAEGEEARVRQLRLQGLRLTAAGPALDELVAQGLSVEVQRLPDGTLSPLRFVPAEGSPPTSSGTPFALNRVRLADARIVFAERSTPRPGRWTLAPFDLTVEGVRSDLGAPLALSARGALDGRPMAIAGTIWPRTPAAEFRVMASGLPLRAALPYLPRLPAVELVSGALDVEGEIQARAAPRGAPAVAFQGELALHDFALRERVRKGDLVRFRRLSLERLRFAGDEVRIAQARLDRPEASLALMPDGAFNYEFLLSEATTVAEAARRMEVDAPKARTRAERRAEARLRKAERQAVAEARARARAQHTRPDLVVRLGRLDVTQGRLEFADLLIRPSFRADVTAVSGTVLGLSNLPGAAATILLKGQVVDRFSPVRIEGRMTPLDWTEDTDLRLSFRNIDLPVFNPYAGAYAGYAIRRGKLTTELSYRVVDAALNAQHQVRIDRLEWGDPAPGERRAPFPVRLVTAVMKDRNGVIAFELPVTGTVDDPEFRLMPLVWKFLGQFVGKIATAPFRALGGLFAGREDAPSIAFAPGSAELPAEAGLVLAELGRALTERPDLRVDVPASAGRALDARALAEARLEAALMAPSGRRRADPKATPPRFTDLEPEDQEDRLEALYRARLGKPPEAPEAGGDRAERRNARIAQLRAALLPLFMPTDDELKALGMARAEAVRLAILGEAAPTEGDDRAERLFLDTERPLAEQDGAVVMTLDLR